MKILGSVIAVGFGVWLMFWIGYTVQPWAPWWISGGKESTTPTGEITIPVNLPPIADGVGGDISLDPPVLGGGRVSDVERYQLITAAGAPRDVAIVMTALSIAEDGSGNPAAVSAPNVGLAAGTRDIGLWQVNSAHIGQCGIQSMEWLFVPINNARAAMCILGPGLNYCAWSTFEERCGVGHIGTYRPYLAGATRIANGENWQH